MKQTQTFDYSTDDKFCFVTIEWNWITGNSSPYLSVTMRSQRASGCCHDQIREIPNIDPRILAAIPFHLCATDGPMHYLENATYLASERDYNGLLKGERRQIRKGGKEPCWSLELVGDDGEPVKPKLSFDGEVDQLPSVPNVRYRWMPWEIEGVGKERDLRGARSAACGDWPTEHPLYLSDEQLCSNNLRQILTDRLPLLLIECRNVVESFGFDWNMDVKS